jgi:hypothetical protein
MDMVYQFSKHPVVLLGRELRTGSELELLRWILSGELVDGDRQFRLSGAAPAHVASGALSLLSEITEDSWWCRAWTFQENYRGGTRIQLLIRHDQSLERQKRRYPYFGNLSCELCIPAVEFSEEATRLCLALLETAQPPDEQRIHKVLRAAGKYSLTLPGSSSMTPTVISDVEARGLSKPWDRLAIVANCCRYPVRLDGGALSRQRCSPSLSVLAMCLLNGEILDNGNDNGVRAAELTASGFLKRLMFQRFNAPQDDARRLTFNKGCRLADVELKASGIATTGHLWELSYVVDTANFPPKLPWIDQPNGRLSSDQRRCLLQLANHLGLRHKWLARRIVRYLDADARARNHYSSSFTDTYLHRMAGELAAAIKARRKLRLGRIWDEGRPSPYRAIFVWPDRSDGPSPLPSAFIFTSVRQADPGTHMYDSNDIDCHVSLVVDKPLGGGDGAWRLRIRSWLLGICFFERCPLTSVVFPWPRSLQAVRP